MALVVQVSGPGALFTRPGLSAERLTYSVMTPSAAVGVLTAIYWKPEFVYRITRIEVLSEIEMFTLRRNETSDLVSLSEAASGGRRVDTVAHRVQRNAVCLKDVSYRIHAQIDLLAHADKPVTAYRDQLRRRVSRGQCFSQPFLGTREFPAGFGDPDDREPIATSADLGMMLHSIDYTSTPRRSSWFRARLVSGVLRVPRHGIADDEAGQG
ncbi:type I-C CRISPR-associated protein Cas5c [Nocardia sp. NPDC005366]|uniref:type I-C CRISPR-associated protein Cas5c n=1 Tax=Nocardia sp. NPDC005366 TaxID=3156878 RepID=UPI0033B5EF9E